VHSTKYRGWKSLESKITPFFFQNGLCYSQKHKLLCCQHWSDIYNLLYHFCLPQWVIHYDQGLRSVVLGRKSHLQCFLSFYTMRLSARRGYFPNLYCCLHVYRCVHILTIDSLDVDRDRWTTHTYREQRFQSPVFCVSLWVFVCVCVGFFWWHWQRWLDTEHEVWLTNMRRTLACSTWSTKEAFKLLHIYLLIP